MPKRARAVEERHVNEEYAASLLDEASRLEPGDSNPVGDHVITNDGDGPIFTATPGVFEIRNDPDRDVISHEHIQAEPPAPPTDRRVAMRENFRRLASKRVTAILEGLDRLKKLANTNVYDWTDEQEHKILGAISERFTEVGRAFEQAKRPRERAEKVKETFEL